MKFRILLLCDVETIESGVARKIEELTQQGARIVIIGKKPSRSPNMIGAPKNDGIVKLSMESTFHSGVLAAPSPEDKLKKSPELLMNWAGQLMNNCGISPGVEFSNPAPNLFQIQFQKDDVAILFLANSDRDKDFVSNISYGEITKYATQWDSETGQKTKLKLNRDGQISINLLPLESMLIVSDPKDNLRKKKGRKQNKSGSTYEITSPWELTLKDVNNVVESLLLESLVPLNELSDLNNFGGEIIYTSQFGIENTSFSELIIDEVYETAEVILNGENLGLSWWGNNIFLIDGNLKKRKNKLEIKVTTLLANYCTSLKDNKTAQFWTSKYKDKTAVKCGLAGKVWLK